MIYGNKTSYFTLLLVCSLNSLFVSNTCAATFMGLGTFPGGKPVSDIRAISGDGSVVVGRGETPSGPEAFRWTLTSGVVGLGELPGGVYESRALDVSFDGQIIVGDSKSSRGIEAVRWTADDGLQRLVDQPTENQAFSVSGDGSIIVGQLGSFPNEDLTIWTENGGLEVLGVPFDLDWAKGEVSSEGNVLVGEAGTSDFDTDVLWRWTRDSGFTSLVELTRNTKYVLTDLTADGSTIVGLMGGPGFKEFQPFRWTMSTGVVPIWEDWDQGSDRIGGVSISGDGSTIVLPRWTGGFRGGDPLGSLIWDDTNGVRELREVLVGDYGLEAELTGWGPLQVRDISDDGRTIIGNAKNAAGQIEAWLAIFEPDILAGDFNSDGSIDTVDFQILADHFGTGTEFSQGDNNRDGIVDLLDFVQFRELFLSAQGDSAAAVPEPNGMILMGFVTLLLASRDVVRAESRRTELSSQSSSAGS